MIIAVLTWLMACIILASTVGLVYNLAHDLIFVPVGLQTEELFSIFGYILLVFIGVELLDTFKNYDLDKSLNVLIVFPVAMIATARSVLLLEVNETSDSFKLLGIAAIITALSIGYYLVKRSQS